MHTPLISYTLQNTFSSQLSVIDLSIFQFGNMIETHRGEAISFPCLQTAIPRANDLKPTLLNSHYCFSFDGADCFHD